MNRKKPDRDQETKDSDAARREAEKFGWGKGDLQSAELSPALKKYLEDRKSAPEDEERA